MKLSTEQLKSLIQNSRLDFRQKNVIGACPVCGESEFGISIEENHRFGCYRLKQCGFTGNIFTLLKHLGRLAEFRDNDGYQRGVEIFLTKKLLHEPIEDSIEIPTIELPIGFRRTYEHEYLKSRGFTEADYEHYKVGVTNLDSKLANYIIFPVEYEERIVGYVGRSILSKAQIKALNDLYKSQGVDKKILRYRNSVTNFSNLVYGLEELTKEVRIVLIVEGIFDKINVDRHLYTLFGITSIIVCVATFKCKISPHQHQLIKDRVNSGATFALFYDPDVLQAILDTGRFLLQRGEEVSVVENKYGDVDPGEMNLEQIEKSLDGMVSYDDFFSNNLVRKELN